MFDTVLLTKYVIHLNKGKDWCLCVEFAVEAIGGARMHSFSHT